MTRKEVELIPRAPSLFASLRDLGYSLETAVADLIDNSIAAGATQIKIFCDPNPACPVLTIIDNGKGMNAEELEEAMRYGSIHPAEERRPDDLGRFGLGLKTASFSQCSLLTVVSAQNHTRNASEWDLKLINRKNAWILSILDEKEISRLPFIGALDATGTLVIWRDMDRLLENSIGSSQQEQDINEKLDMLRKHLSLVFHRFLEGETKIRRGRVSISVNGHELEPFDPFCRKNSATQILAEESIYVDGNKVRMQPYILPHHSKLSPSEYDYYQDRSDFQSNQGAYVYRNGRLMAWGDWFRLISKGESTKLARVQIDFSNALDQHWKIDIKKSRATPPYEVRERLKRVIDRISESSARVHRGRGKRLYDEIKMPVWLRYASEGRIRYTLNREHLLVQALNADKQDKAGNEVDVLLDAIESSLPIELIYSDFSDTPKDVRQYQLEKGEVLDKLRQLKGIFSANGKDNAGAFREVVRSMRVFEEHMDDIVEPFIREEFL